MTGPVRGQGSNDTVACAKVAGMALVTKWSLAASLRQPRCRRLLEPLDRWLCVPAFRRGCRYHGTSIHASLRLYNAASEAGSTHFQIPRGPSQMSDDLDLESIEVVVLKGSRRRATLAVDTD